MKFEINIPNERLAELVYTPLFSAGHKTKSEAITLKTLIVIYFVRGGKNERY